MMQNRAAKSEINLPFYDRQQAGDLLAEKMQSLTPKNPAVIALPRGGVVVGAAVARALHAPLDVVMVRKLGVPWQPELAMGAIAGTRVRILDEALIRHLDISPEEIEEISSREAWEVKRREEIYRQGRPPLDLSDRTAILVDDGLATGSTMLAAIRYVEDFGPRAVIVAVPVAPREAAAQIERAGAEFIALATPEPFYAVGTWYEDFRQVSDREVCELLASAKAEQS